MHVYIYDSFLNQNKYQNLLAKIETRITDLGLNGKICRLGVVKNYYDLIQGEIKRGAKTIVAVGDDSTVNQIINSMAGSEIPLGIVPIGKNNNDIAKALGIEPEIAACDILSARRIEKIDLAQANDTFFLTEGTITTKDTILSINSNYSIEISDKGIIKIINLPLSKAELPKEVAFNPQDKSLELYIRTESNGKFLKKSKNSVGESIFPFDQLTIENKDSELLTDNVIKIKTPVQIRMADIFINIIVGKNRAF